MSYEASSYQNSRGNDPVDDEQQPLVTENDRDERRKKSKQLRRRIQLMCASILVLFVVAAVYVVARTAIRTRDIRHHQVIAEHQIADLNARKTLAAMGCESTIVLMRHCEKTGPNTTDAAGNRHCSAVGMDRAEFLPTLFGKQGRWPNPKAIYALSMHRVGKKHMNFREIETLEPLAEQANVGINSKFHVGHEPYLAEHIFDKLASGVLCDGVSVISWKHTHIPAMSASLGCGKNEGCPSFYPDRDFEQLWIIHYVYGPTAHDGEEEEGSTRNLKKKKAPDASWTVSGSVTRQGFDPRQHSIRERREGDE